MVAGCQQEFEWWTCPTWDELEIVDEAGAGTEVVDETRAAIDEFAGWSGREGVCVSEVRLVEEIVSKDGQEFGGMYYHWGWIELAIDSTMTEVVRHELCHAVDHREGWASEDHPELFGDEDPREVFASLCEDGPRNLTLAAALAGTCGESEVAAKAFVDELVYPDADVEESVPTGTVAIEFDGVAVEGLPDSGDHDPLVVGGDIWAFGNADDDGRAVAIRVELETGAASLIELPTGFESGTLAQSDGAVLLIGDDATGAWRYIDAVWTAQPFLDFSYVRDAAVIGDTAWVLGRVSDGVKFYRFDLASSEAKVYAHPEDVSGFQLDRGGLIARATDEAGHYWLRFLPDTGVWSREEDPVGWVAYDRASLADGREVAMWYADDVGETGTLGLAVRDVTTDRWWLAEFPCGEDSIEYANELLSVDGEVWVWFSAGGLDAVARLTLP